MAYRRWQTYRNGGGERLLRMAYFVLTVLLNAAGGLEKAASAFAVDRDILKKLGELTSTRGGAMTARKVERGSTLKDLSGPEAQWVDDLVRRLVIRLGERASGAALVPLIPRDLPLPP